MTIRLQASSQCAPGPEPSHCGAANNAGQNGSLESRDGFKRREVFFFEL